MFTPFDLELEATWAPDGQVPDANVDHIIARNTHNVSCKFILGYALSLRDTRCNSPLSDATRVPQVESDTNTYLDPI